MNEKKHNSINTNLFMIAVAILIFLVIPSQVDGSKLSDSLGARFVPYLGSGLVLIPNVIQLIYKLMSRKKEEVEKNVSSKTEKRSAKELAQSLWSRYDVMTVTLAAVFAASFAMEKIGYIICCCLLCTLMLAMFKEKRWYYYLITYVLVVIVFIGFTKFLYVPLPTLT